MYDPDMWPHGIVQEVTTACYPLHLGNTGTPLVVLHNPHYYLSCLNLSRRLLMSLVEPLQVFPNTSVSVQEISQVPLHKKGKAFPHDMGLLNILDPGGK